MFPVWVCTGQNEARRFVAPPIGLKNVRLEPPPCNLGFNSLLESRTFSRPERPQHTRGVGRKWSSFDDQAFLHQKVNGNPWSPFPKQTSPRFYSPKAPGPAKDMNSRSSFCNLNSSSPLLHDLVGSSNSIQVSPHLRSPPTMGMGLKPCPLQTGPQNQSHHGEDQIMESPGHLEYPIFKATDLGELQVLKPNTPPMIELDIPRSNPPGMKTAENQAVDQSILQGMPPTSWRLEGSMFDDATWNEQVCIAPLGDKEACCSKEIPKDIHLASDWEIAVSELKLGPKIGQVVFYIEHNLL